MIVRLQNINKSFGNVEAVKDLSLKVESGKFLVLLGPSGCGKTTTLRMIAGLEIQDEGDIYFGDRVVNELEPRERKLAMVFQNYALYPHMSVFENISFPLKIKKLPKNEIKERVGQVASVLRIEGLLDRKPKQISGGEAQRVALGRSLIVDSDVLLMDEPLSNLDAKLRTQMRAELELLHRELRKTTIYVTHDQIEAMTIGEQIAIMNKGVLQQVGTPTEVYSRPSNRFVAEFLGSPQINMLEATIIEKAGRLGVAIDGCEILLPRGVELNVRNSRTSNILVGVRAENLFFSAKKRDNAIAAEVLLVESIGSDLFVYLVHQGKRIIGRTEPSKEISVGNLVWITLDTGKCHFFDAESGMSLYHQQKVDTKT